MTARSAADLVSTWIKIFKNVPAEQLEDLKRVEDIWNEPGGQFSNPTRAEIKTGSPQESSGGGAERMVRQYSDPAPQMGMTEKYAEFSSMLSSFGKALQTHDAQITALAQMVKGAAEQPAATTKSVDTDSALAKAELKLKKARSELRKADMADDEDKEEREEKKSFLAEAQAALKSAKRLLTKAEDEERKEDDEDRAEKARADLRQLTKALKKAEDEGTEREKKEEDEMEKARAAKAAAEKAIADAATAKAEAEAATTAAATTTVKAEEKEEKDEAKKAREAAEAEAAMKAAGTSVDPTVRDQIALLNTSVKGLMDVVMAGSKGRPLPAFIKGAAIADLGAKVDAAIEAGALEDPYEIMKAQTIVTHVRAVQAGHLDAAVVDDEIAKAPTNVRQLFAVGAAA